MPSVRLQERPMALPDTLAAASGRPMAANDDLAPRRAGHLRLVWPATPRGEPARAPGLMAPHAGAACRLYCPAPRPTSSAPRLRERWVLEFEPTRRQEPDRLIGWVGGGDPLGQVRLAFPSKAAALAYAERHGLICEVREPRRRRATPRPYAERFLNRPEPEAWPGLLAAA